jgi:parvulin-like peptidyl-prolyl isomerase
MTTMRWIAGILFSLLVASAVWADGTDQQILLSAGDITVTTQDLRQQLLLLPEAERARVLAGPSAVKDFLRRIYQSKHMVVAAERLKLNDDPMVQARLVAQQRRILAEALREHTRKQIQPPDFAALARENYAVRRDEFQLPEQFKAAHILKKVQCDCEREEKRRALAQLRVRLQAGEDFAALAKTESDDTGSAAQGGDMGRWLKREDVVAPFVDALAKLETGQLSEVVETQYGFHLIKKLDYQPARLQSFDEVRESLEQRLRRSYVDDQLVERSGDYLPPADAKFDESALQSLLPGH